MAGRLSSTLIYDGDCGFCTKSAKWIAARWDTGEPAAVPWQQIGASGLGVLGLSVEDCRQAAWWVDAAGRLHKGHLAIGKALGATSGWGKLGGRLIVAPYLNHLAGVVYRVVARHRYRMPGSSAACRLPDHPDLSDGDWPARAP